ncbi:MAG: sugar phosphate isomerase/epimerase [Fimbriimonadaceae bacterium]|nr:sugar phosphate isomerase/epimerase [Fimbriimonadaceae bacterium]
MRIACSTSFHRGDLPTALATIARLGFREVDLICIPQWEHVVPADLVSNFAATADQVAGLLAQHGLTAIAGNLALGHLYQRDSTLTERLAQAAAVARLMQRLGVRLVSCYPGYRTDQPAGEVLAATAATLRELLDIGAAHGVQFLVEPHKDTPWESVAAGEALLAAVPELQVAYDPSHYAMQGIPLEATRGILARAGHVHFRGAAPGRMQAPAAESTVDVEALVTALRQQGYAGDASLEFLPDLPEVAQELTSLRQRVATAWEVRP